MLTLLECPVLNFDTTIMFISVNGYLFRCGQQLDTLLIRILTYASDLSCLFQLFPCQPTLFDVTLEVPVPASLLFYPVGSISEPA